MEQAIVTPAIRRHMQGNARTTSARTPNHNVLRVASKLGDVLLHPLEDFSLVLEAVVGTAPCGYLPRCQEAVRPDSVVKVDYNYIESAGCD